MKKVFFLTRHYSNFCSLEKLQHYFFRMGYENNQTSKEIESALKKLQSFKESIPFTLRGSRPYPRTVSADYCKVLEEIISINPDGTKKFPDLYIVDIEFLSIDMTGEKIFSLFQYVLDRLEIDYKATPVIYLLTQNSQHREMALDLYTQYIVIPLGAADILGVIKEGFNTIMNKISEVESSWAIKNL